MSKASGAGGRTAKAVALRADVSVTTVSRVLNGRDAEISQETRDRVLAAAREIGYRPNSLAAALRRGVTNTIGLLVPDISDAYFHNVARGVEDLARSSGYMVILCDTDRVPERERDYVQLLQDKRVDGIVFCGGGIEGEQQLPDLIHESVHVVTIGPHELPFPNIRTDDVGAFENAVDHLADEGCERILCLAGRKEWQVSRHRLRGYRRGLKKHGLSTATELVVHGEFGQQAGYDGVTASLAAGVDFDGVIAFNDYAAIGAILAIQDSGRSVPDDVAVVGCDDIAVASVVHPTLTSIGFPQYEFGRTAMEKILAMAKDQRVEPKTTFPYHLRIRASSDRSGRTA